MNKTVLKDTMREKRSVVEVDNRPYAEKQRAAFYYRTHKQVNKISKSCLATMPIRP